LSQTQHAQVAFPIPVDSVFTYVVPESLSQRVSLGSHVLASLGGRKLSGFVVGLEPREGLKGLRPLQALIRPEPIFDPAMLELCRRVAEHYLSPLGEILAAAYPGHADKRPRPAPADDLNQQDVAVPESGDDSVLREAAGPERDAEGSSLASRVLEPPDGGAPRVFVLDAVDTVRERLYPDLASQVVVGGGSVLFLVPEVSTSSPLAALLKTRFGARMALFHSMLRISERKNMWEDCRAGRLRVMVGTRSAVFLPLRELRLIVVEDEHAQPYKQEETPRYNGRDAALMRARVAHIPIVLASATPSVETHLALKQGEYRRLALEDAAGSPERAGPDENESLGRARPLTRPVVTVVDMRDWDNAEPGADEFSRPLAAAVRRCLEERKRTLIFLNRRGFSTYVQCQDCGSVETCPSCELPMVLHSGDGALVCHHCGHRTQAPSSCRKCRGARFRFGGAGIEKVEAQLKGMAPLARVGRIDLDSAGTREGAAAAVGKFARGELDVLLGTLMVMKGFDLGRINLVGVLHAETQLNIPDFRSGERAFQLLSEVVALAGTEGSGEVIIQTLNPEHNSVTAVAAGDSPLFYEQELKQREELGYPPFSTLVAVHISGPKEPQVSKVVESAATAAASVASSLERQGLPVRVLGPSPGFPARSRGQFRWRMSIRAEKREAAVRAAREILAQLGGKHDVGGVTVSLDVDPVGA
jgi:primosomal protein N' (replication factor Y)